MTDVPNDLPKELPQSRTAQLLAELPEYLKNRANYKKIQKAILQAGATKHSHSDVTLWAACFVCQRKQNDRLLMMKSLGFRSRAHYMAWQKIHEHPLMRTPLR